MAAGGRVDQNMKMTMMPTSVYKYLAIGAIALAILAAVAIGSYFYGIHTEKGVYAAAILKQTQDNAKKVADVNKTNTTLATKNGELQQQIKTLQQRIATQPVKEHYVYVHEKPTQPPVMVTGPVYVTAAAVSLFNASFGLSDISSASTSTDESSGSIPSLVTVSDYQRTTTQNAVACYSNQVTLGELQAYVKALEKQGAIHP